MSSTRDVLSKSRTAAAVKPVRTNVRSMLRAFAHAMARWTIVIALLVAWETGVRTGLPAGRAFPAPSEIVRTIIEMARAGTLQTNVWTSVARVFVGVGIASVLGVSLGAVLARNERAAFLCTPLIELLRPISVIAWIPVAIIWFGLGDASARFIIALGAFFPIFTSTFLGVKQIPPIYLQAAQTMGLSRWLVLRYVLGPCALPTVLSGIRVGLGVGWMCVIAAEMISSTSGLGYMIQMARVMIETEQVFAGMVVVGIVGYLMNGAMVMLETKATPWTH